MPISAPYFLPFSLYTLPLLCPLLFSSLLYLSDPFIPCSPLPLPFVTDMATRHTPAQGLPGNETVESTGKQLFK